MSTYALRRRPHNRELVNKTSRLVQSSFIVRMLFGWLGGLLVERRTCVSYTVNMQTRDAFRTRSGRVGKNTSYVQFVNAYVYTLTDYDDFP